MYWILFTVLAAFLVWYALSRVGTRVIFRPQNKRWPMKLPFENISFPRRTAN